ncbi:MAG TPA: hypothetical protein VJZ00_24420 [Thermoanaerobaculia bacterium]|nr:hypothetical protein [Thermoanaerobaculia bacterium]
MRRLYLLCAIVAAVIVFFANDAINTFLGESSTFGAILLFAILPLAAILTRPVVVAAQRGREQRAIGIVYALRSFRIGFFLRSIAWWLLFSAIVVAAIAFLYREAEMQAAAGVSNWWYLVNLFVLLLHLVPGQFRLPPAPPVTIVVAGPRNAGKSTFIGLLPLDELPRDWTVMPSDPARRLLLNLHARAKGDTEIDIDMGTPRLTFLRPRVWSKYVGTRPLPVDFVEATQLRGELPKRAGVAVILPANGSITAELQKQLREKINAPVAVILTKSDLAPDVEFPPDAAALLDARCRKWKAFTASDRGGEPSELEGFSPRGYMAAALWLLGGIR